MPKHSFLPHISCPLAPNVLTEEFYGTEDLAVHNVDVMTDASAFTAFTRYTVAPTTSAPSRATTKRSSRSKRKMERKVGSGRKGTVDEEEYLLKSLTKLAGKLSEAQGASPLIYFIF